MRVLVVDDSSTQRLILKNLLTTHFSCTVSEAGNGVEALALIEESPPEVVFLDVVMPVLDGVETLEAIRASTKFRSIPVVIVSGISDRTVAAKMVDLGVLDYLAKPLDPSRIVDRLQRVLDGVTRLSTRGAEKNANARPPGERTALLVDGDAEFLAFAIPLLGRFSKVTQARSGVDAWEAAQGNFWDVVCIGEELGLLNHVLLAQKMRASSDHGHSRIVRLVSQVIPNEGDDGLFDSVMHKLSDAEELAGEFQRKVFPSDSGKESIRRLVGGELRDELSKAVDQAIGITCSQHLTVEIGARPELGGEPIQSSWALVAEGWGSTRVDITLSTSERHARDLSTAVTRSTATRDDAKDLVRELVNIVTGAVRTALAKYGLSMTEVGTAPRDGLGEETGEALLSVTVTTERGQSLVVDLDLAGSEVGEVAA